MTPDASQARRYLLGQLPDDEAATIEQAYLTDVDALDALAAAEEDLLEDYLTDRLPADTRAIFETYYLGAPQHRARLETVRRLMSAAATPGQGAPVRRRAMVPPAWLLAAAALLVALVGVWMLRPQPSASRPASAANVRPADDTAPLGSGAQARTPAEGSHRAFAFTVPPIAVRGDGEKRPLMIPSGTDDVTLRLEEEPGTGRIEHVRAVIRTVSGAEVWRGDAASDPEPGFAARVEVPARVLRPDDYIIALSGVDRSGTERELSRYFLEVRARPR